MSEVPIADQAPPAPVEVSMDFCQDADKGKEAEAPQGKVKDKGKDKKDSSKLAEKASDTAISQLEQDTDLGAPKTKA